MPLGTEQEQEERLLSMPTSTPQENPEGGRGESARVMVVDDHSVVVSGLQLALEYQGFEVVATAKSAEAAIKRCLELEPDVLLLDIHMPHGEGFEVLQRLQAAGISTEVIMLTASLRAEDRRRAQELGASGYVSKEIMPDQLAETIRSALRGKLAADEVVGNPVGQTDADAPADAVGARLTDQETQVLRLIASGKDNRAISETLYVSVNTVKTHVTNILAKLGVENRTQAAVWAIRHGIAEESEADQ